MTQYIAVKEIMSGCIGCVNETGRGSECAGYQQIAKVDSCGEESVIIIENSDKGKAAYVARTLEYHG